MNTICATRDNGQIFVAENGYYVGKIQSARLFQRSITITIGKKNYCVDKKSYQTFLRSKQTTKQRMQDVLSPQKKRRLFYKLARAIHGQNETKALQVITKGAEIDRSYYDHGEFGITFHHNRYCHLLNMRSDKIQLTTFYGKVIHHAAQKSMKKVVECLLEYGVKTEKPSIERTLDVEMFEYAPFPKNPYFSVIISQEACKKYSLNTKNTLAEFKEDMQTPRVKFSRKDVN